MIVMTAEFLLCWVCGDLKTFAQWQIAPIAPTFWGKSKIHFRQSKKERTAKNLVTLIKDSVSKDVLTLRVIRKVARKAVDKRRICKRYKLNLDTDLGDYEAVQRMDKECNAHRSALDQFYKFIKETNE